MGEFARDLHTFFLGTLCGLMFGAYICDGIDAAAAVLLGAVVANVPVLAIAWIARWLWTRYADGPC